MWMGEFAQDLRFAGRQFRKSPVMALAAVVTLGLGMGANTAVFRVLNGVLLSPLPYPDSNELVEVRTRYLPASGFDIDRFPISVPELVDYRTASKSYEVMGIYSTGTKTLTGAGDPIRVPTAFLDREALEALNVEPEIGRWFTAEEDLPGVSIGLIGHDLWLTRFGSDPSILGQTIMLEGRGFLITGVMPADFAFPSARFQVFENFGIDPANLGNRMGHGSYGIGRLRPNVTMAQMLAESEGIQAGWEEEYPHNVAHFPIFERLEDRVVGTDVRRALLILMGAVGVVLLIAAVNVANLLMARGESRQHEVAVRNSLGASRGRIIRQLLTESLTLSVLGAVLGLGLGVAGLNALLSINPNALPRSELIGLDGKVLLFTGGVTIVIAALFGLAPALQAGRAPASALGGSAKTTATRGQRRFRRILVASEVALSLVVVLAAGLIVRSFQRLTAVDPGVDIDGKLVFYVSPTGDEYRSADAVVQFYGQLQERLSALPGVASVSGVTHLPLSGTGSRADFLFEGRDVPGAGEPIWSAQWTSVLPGYFETMGIVATRGRLLDAGDVGGAEPVVVISEGVAEEYLAGADPIGMRVGLPFDTVPWARVVGIVPRTRTHSLEADVIPQIYFTHSQGPSIGQLRKGMWMTLQTDVPPQTLVGAARRIVGELEPRLPLTNVGTMEDVFSRSVAQPKLITNLIGSFALIALVLAAIGIYGVVSYSVSKRTREIGIRMALGAERGAIARLMVQDGAWPALVGVLVGIPIALTASNVLGNLLYEVSPQDPAVFVSLPLILLAIAVISSYLPARRATRLSPTEALRDT